MSPKAINLNAKFDCYDDHWSPRVIAELNDYQFKLEGRGGVRWHSHADTDEAFVVVEGMLEIEFRDHTVTINAGEMIVVPGESSTGQSPVKNAKSCSLNQGAWSTPATHVAANRGKRRLI